MAKFCKYCGTQLNDDQICACPQAQAEAAAAQKAYQQPQQVYQPQQPQQAYQQPQAAPAAPAAPSPIATAFKNLIPFLKAYFQSPVNAARSVVAQNDFLLAIILLLIQAISVGLMIFSLMSKLCGTLEGIVLSVMGFAGMGSNSLFGGVVGPTVGASFPMCLIFGIVASVIAIAIFAVIVFAVAKIMKSTCSFKSALIACGAHSPFVTILFLLTFILFFLSIKFGLIAFLFAMLAWVVMSIPTIQAVTSGTEQGKFWISCIVAVLVAMLVGGWVSSKFLGMSAKATTISYGNESITIGKMLEEAGEIELDFEEVMEDLLYNIF